MKICILTHTFPRNKHDTSAAFMKEFADGLVEAGNDVVVVTPFDPVFLRKKDKFEIIKYKYIWPDNLHILGYSQTMSADIGLKKRAYILLPFMLFFGTIALFRVVKKTKPNIINVHWILPNGLMALVVSKLTGVPYVITLPGTDAYLATKNKYFGIVAKIVANNSAGIVSNSSFILKKFMKLGIKNQHTAVISYPADVSNFKPSKKNLSIYRKKLEFTKDNFVIMAVGRLVYKKGFNYLIRAFYKVSKKYPESRLIIAGEGDLMMHLQDLVAKFEIGGKVVFAGTISRDEIKYFYNLCDVLVAPSIVDKKGNVDGGPLVSLESMACAKPQILTSILGMADEMENGINGYIVPQKSTKALEISIEKLIKNPKLRKKMGKLNRSLATKNLSTKSIGKRYTKFFNEI